MSSVSPTVFIIDDDNAVLSAIESLVASVGLRTEAYASAPTFLSGYQRTEAGCVLVDMRLPGMSGLDRKLAGLSSAVLVRAGDIEVGPCRLL